MGKLTVTARNSLLDHIYNSAYTPPASTYLALFIGDPTGAGSEVATDTYVRQPISFGAASSRAVTQNAEISFPEAEGSWGEDIGYYAIYDAETGGNMLGTGTFSSSWPVVAGNTPIVASGECVITVSATTGSEAGFSTWAANKMLDLMFNNTAWSTPKDSLYIAMSHSTLDDADAATADFTEQTGTGYSRTNLPSASMGAASSGAVTNTAKVTLASPTADDWTEVVSLVTLDASAAGNIIAYDNANVENQTPGNGDTSEIRIGDYDQALT